MSRPANAWINEKSIAEAQALLAHSGTGVQEVAFRLGVSDISHFSKFFKKQTGLTPTQFSNQS